MHTFLSHDWAGMAMAAMVAAVATGLFVWLRKRWIAIPVGLIALALTIGSAVHLYQVAEMDDRFPPPGKFVEVDGQKLHVLSEGPAGSELTIVLFGGGHAPGTSMMHLHDALKSDYRSVLIDRPGMGWSGPASFPLSTVGEAGQMWETLEKAGEKGPYMLAGHSFGGLLVANMARLEPEKVHSLVLIDPTPPDAIVYGPRLEQLASLRNDPWWSGFLRLFAIDYDKLKAQEPVPPAIAELEQQIARVMGKNHAIQKAYAKRPRAQMAAHSIFRELSAKGMAATGYEIGFFDGELGDMPLYLFAPQNLVGVDDMQVFQNAEEREAMRLPLFYQVVRERFMAASNNSTRIVAPEGTGHNFIYEVPDYTIDVLRQIAAGTYDKENPEAGDTETESET